jgi:hypothetical protein
MAPGADKENQKNKENTAEKIRRANNNERIILFDLTVLTVFLYR